MTPWTKVLPDFDDWGHVHRNSQICDNNSIKKNCTLFELLTWKTASKVERRFIKAKIKTGIPTKFPSDFHDKRPTAEYQQHKMEI